MKGEWCYFKEWFSDEQCNRIIELADSIPFEDSKIGVDGVLQTSEIRKSRVKFIPVHDPNFQWLYDDLWRMAREANNDWFGFNISKLDYIQLAEYDASYEGEYQRHHDVFWMNGDPKFHRKLSCVVQLTDPSEYEGGDLSFYHTMHYPKAEDVRSRGTATFFPSFTEHSASKVTKGKRYSLACWFDGPKWV